MKPLDIRGLAAGVMPAVGRALVVVGMHRSGTSAMTRTLSLLGAKLPDRLMEAQENNNETGFWEPRSVADLNEEILQALDSGWDDVFAFRKRPYLSNFDRVYAGRAVELIEREFAGSELIVLKDPRVSVLTSFWERALSEAGYGTHYVVMVRNPLEIAESLRARDGFPREKSLLLWSSYMTAVERDTRGLSRTFVSYDQLIRDWRAARRRIEDGLGVPFPRDTAAAGIEIDRFVSRRLRHHESLAEDLFSSPDVPEHVKTLYRIFSDACEGGELDSSAIDAVESELTNVDRLVGPLVADLRSQVRTLSNEVDQFERKRAEATGRADSAAQELATERALREEASAAHARAVAEQQRAAREAAEQSRRERAELETALQAEAATARAEAAAAEARVAEQSEQVRELQIKAAAAEARVAERSEQVRELQIKEAAAAEEREQLAAELRQQRKQKESVEGRLNERFHEIATLSNLLADAEATARESAADADWLRTTAAVLLLDSRGWKGRLSRWLPAALQHRRQLRLLKRRGLFDPDAYLAVHADVAAQGTDPLRHYLTYGLSEHRRRD